MRETVELRIPEEHARRFLATNEGAVMGSAEEIRLLGPSVRKLVLDIRGARYQEIGEIARRMVKQEGKAFYHGWTIHRSYTRKELAVAPLLQLIPTAYFEPAGEACGTSYDYGSVCQFCGAGRIQSSELTLDLRKAPRSKDFAATIAEEWLVSQRLAELMVDHRVSGVELRPVQHKARYRDDSYVMARYPAGRELLRRAEEAGCPYPQWQFYAWLNRYEQTALRSRLDIERVEAGEMLARIKPPMLPVWYQLVVTSQSVPVVPPTRFGVKPIDDGDEDGDSYRCPLGHVLGLNVLSELYVSRAGWDGSDVAVTRQLYGCRRGVLVPRPFLLVSQRLYGLLRANSIKGFNVEVVHLV